MAAPAPAPATTLTPRRTLTVFAAVLTVWVTLDQITKQIAVEHFTTPRDLGIARLVLVRNPNAAFGIPGFPGLFIAVTLLVLVLVVRSLPKVTSLPVTVAYGLVVGGAVGNAIDRVVREPGFPQGAVIDFIHLGPWFPWTFNLADSGITVGAAFLIVLLWRERPEE